MSTTFKESWYVNKCILYEVTNKKLFILKKNVNTNCPSKTSNKIFPICKWSKRKLEIKDSLRINHYRECGNTIEETLLLPLVVLPVSVLFIPILNCICLQWRTSERCLAVQCRAGQSKTMLQKTAGCCKDMIISFAFSGVKGLTCSPRERNRVIDNYEIISYNMKK